MAVKRENTFLVITDFETTGLDPLRDYPIEIGCIFLDPNLDVVSTFESLILPPQPEKLVIATTTTLDKEYIIPVWEPAYHSAFNVHGITLEELFKKGISPRECVNRLFEIIDYVKKETGLKNGRFIITSDNAQFEFNFMKRLFALAGEEKWVFHYAAWDTNILLDYFFTDIGDPAPKHRALADCWRLYKQLIRCAERLNFFNKP